MALATAGRNSAADGLAAVIGFLSVHTGDPSTTGANEATGGSPPYARKAVTWAGPSGGQRLTGTAAVTWDLPAGTYFWVGGFSLVTAGTWYGATPFGGVTPKPATYVASTDFFTSPGHGLANDMRCVVWPAEQVAIPTGYTEGTTYWVVGVSGNTFQLSATQGGAAVNGTTDGVVWFQQSLPETLNAQGQLSVPIGSGAIDARAA